MHPSRFHHGEGHRPLVYLGLTFKVGHGWARNCDGEWWAYQTRGDIHIPG